MGATAGRRAAWRSSAGSRSRCATTGTLPSTSPSTKAVRAGARSPTTSSRRFSMRRMTGWNRSVSGAGKGFWPLGGTLFAGQRGVHCATLGPGTHRHPRRGWCRQRSPTRLSAVQPCQTATASRARGQGLPRLRGRLGRAGERRPLHCLRGDSPTPEPQHVRTMPPSPALGRPGLLALREPLVHGPVRELPATTDGAVHTVPD